MTVTQQLEEQIKTIQQQIEETQQLSNDPSYKELAEAELKELESQKQALEDSIAAINGEFSDDSNGNSDDFDQNNAIMEIRGGAGGDEAKIFADDLLRMYLRYIETTNLKVEKLDDHVIKIKGKGAYGIFKYESGVHRVQRVPTTESQGRVHTSTTSVAVLPEVTPTQIEVREEDLDWKFTRAGGKGGQNVNKVNTAVMLTHTPSGLVIHCRQERSQQQNRQVALQMLRSQLWELEEEKRLSEIESTRKEAVGRNMRAEKIRTYNFPQNRVTDHRINKSWYELDKIIEGDLKKLFATTKKLMEESEED